MPTLSGRSRASEFPGASLSATVDKRGLQQPFHIANFHKSDCMEIGCVRDKMGAFISMNVLNLVAPW